MSAAAAPSPSLISTAVCFQTILYSHSLIPHSVFVLLLLVCSTRLDRVLSRTWYSFSLSLRIGILLFLFERRLHVASHTSAIPGLAFSLSTVFLPSICVEQHLDRAPHRNNTSILISSLSPWQLKRLLFHTICCPFLVLAARVSPSHYREECNCLP